MNQRLHLMLVTMAVAAGAALVSAIFPLPAHAASSLAQQSDRNLEITP